jgi:hypothetical protein
MIGVPDNRFSSVSAKMGNHCCNREFMETTAILNMTPNHLKHPILRNRILLEWSPSREAPGVKG